MTQQLKQGFRAWFNPTNGTTIISALSLAWLITWQGGGAVVGHYTRFTDTVEVTRQRSLANQSNLSAYKIDVNIADTLIYREIADVKKILTTQKQ